MLTDTVYERAKLLRLSFELLVADLFKLHTALGKVESSVIITEFEILEEAIWISDDRVLLLWNKSNVNYEV